jgi:hypothetical protein
LTEKKEVEEESQRFLGNLEVSKDYVYKLNEQLIREATRMQENEAKSDFSDYFEDLREEYERLGKLGLRQWLWCSRSRRTGRTGWRASWVSWAATPLTI